MKLVLKFIRLQLALIFTIPFLRLLELVFLSNRIKLPESTVINEFFGLFYDLEFFIIFSLLSFGLFAVLYLLSRKLASISQKVLNALVLVSISSLIIFFSERGAALDQEIVQQSIKESLLVVMGNDSFSLINILIISLPLALYFLFDYLLIKKWKLPKLLSIILFSLFTLIAIITFTLKEQKPKTYKVAYQLKANKLSFLIEKIINYKYFTINGVLTESDVRHFQKYFGHNYVSVEYPLLHKNEMHDVLGPFLKKAEEKPNLVYIIVESLSASMNGYDSKYRGMITPYFDSLSNQSLYWSNCMSSSSISFEILPTLVASAPYGKVGFNSIPFLPHHQSIVKILNKENYYSAFISGSPIYFANQGGLMRAQNTRFIVNKFDKKYKPIDNGGNWSWGYADRELFRQGLDYVDSLFTTPYINFYITITTHPPYVFQNSEQYQKKFVERVKAANLSDKEQDFFIKNKKMFASFMSFDDELKWFMESYKKRPEYKNTIFIITGDHQGYYEPKNAANHFRVPLVIYSPLIKKPVHFKSVALHAQVSPTMINYLANNYDVKAPSYVSWMADDLDTCRTFRNRNTYPFIYWNKEIIDLIHDDYYLNGEDLYKIKAPGLDLEPYKNDSVKQLMNQLLEEYNMINHYVCFEDKIIPDSLYDNVFHFDSLVYNYIDTTAFDTNLMYPFGTHYAIGKDSSLIKFSISFNLKIPDVKYDRLPKLVISVENPGEDEKVFYDSKELSFLTDEDLTPNKLLYLRITDILDLSKLPVTDKSIIKIYLYNSQKLDIYYANFKVSLYKQKNKE
ncbi:MAG: hypothetical protein DSY76_02325 [Bacteroidetes bacterium]|nr:MAG: hypothetical protein DSY76_02325 [Bacteroidota bacterium]